MALACPLDGLIVSLVVKFPLHFQASHLMIKKKKKIVSISCYLPKCQEATFISYYLELPEDRTYRSVTFYPQPDCIYGHVCVSSVGLEPF